MTTMHAHFALLDTDRDHDDYGPIIPVEILNGWKHDPELWGFPYVQRTPEGVEGHVIVTEGMPSLPVFRLPETMRPSETAFFPNDWRCAFQLRAEPDGYVYADVVWRG